MSDLIERQAAIDAVRSYMADNDIEDSDWHADGIVYEIKRLPTVETKTGQWIKIHWKAYRCSECSRASEYSTDYCPNCGAEMKEDTDETD